MKKTIQQLRQIEAGDMTLHDAATLEVLSALVQTQNEEFVYASDSNIARVVNQARSIADEFLLQREQNQ